MILILSSHDDPHAKEVIKHLEETGNPHRLLDLSEYPRRMSMTMQYNGHYESHFRFGEAEKPFDLSETKAVWWRRPQHFVLHPEIKEHEHAQFAYREMEEAFTGLWQNTDCFWINAPHLDLFASRKAYQLKVAHRLGLTIPETLITNDVAEARQFVQQNGFEKTVYKPFSGTLNTWRETRVLKENELAMLENVKYAPLIFQEYIPAAADLRITAVGRKLFPAAIYSQSTQYPQDCRMDIGNADIRAVELPVQVTQQLLALMEALNLQYGAIDMRLTPQGDYVFLEINPAGQWLFVEYKTNQPISREIAGLLADGGQH